MSYSSPDEVEQYVRLQVAAGFESTDTIAELAVDIYEADPEVVEEIVAAEAADKAEECAKWPATTDCDRLDRAFASLDTSGVLARQNFACCNRCGHFEMTDLVHDERERGRAIDGYAFYHQQDTDSVVAGGSLHLRYDSMSDSAEAKTAIGHRVVEALQAQGLTVEWNEDPEATIQLPSFDWKRRGAPVAEAHQWTPAAAVDHWCQRLPMAKAAELSCALGDGYAAAAVSADCIDAAIAWARSARCASNTGHTRSNALMRVAVAARAFGLSGEQTTRLWAEAFQAAPYGKFGDLVNLLLAADLEDPAIRAAAHDRVFQTRRDIFGAAAVAWYLVRAPLAADDEEGLSAMLEGIQRVLDSSDTGHELEDAARAAVASALWVILHRRGEVEKAQAARDSALEFATSSYVADGISPLFAQRAVVAAAAALDQLGDITPRLVELYSHALPFELVDALVCSKKLDAAVELVGHLDQPPWLLARLARRAAEDARATEWIALAEKADHDLDELFDEGVYTADEVRDTRLELAALRGEQGSRDRARADTSGVAAKYRDEIAANGVEVYSHLESVSCGDCGPGPPVDVFLSTADGASRLEDALAKWEAGGSGRQRQIRLRRVAATIMEGAVAHACGGELDRGRALIERVYPEAKFELVAPVFEGPLVAAWVATDQLERALGHVKEHGASPETIAPITVRLAELDRHSEALELLGPVLDRTETLSGLIALVPAVLAISPNLRDSASAMLNAWDSGDAALGSLLVS